MSRVDLSVLVTEARNPRSMELDALSTADFVAVMVDEDRAISAAIAAEAPRIAAAIDAIAARMHKGGRLVYAGAGTSGRLAVLDAAECAPTFSAAPGQVVAVIAGGSAALVNAVEGAEDDRAAGEAEMARLQLGPKDSVVGISASGRTPFVLAALAAARAAGALTIGVAMNADSEVGRAAELGIEVATGAEVLAGSTRLKAGTATKMVLNMLSTGAFVRLNKVYRNLMVDLQASNQKLRARSVRIVADATGCGADEAPTLLAAADGEVKVAIVARLRQIEPHVARTLLFTHDGSVRAALEAPLGG